VKFKNNWLIISIVFAITLLIYNLYSSSLVKEERKELSYSLFLKKLDNNEINKVTIMGNSIKSEDKAKKIYVTVYPYNDYEFIKSLKNKGVEIVVLKGDESSSSSSYTFLIAILFFIIIWFLFFRNNKGGSGGSMGGGGSSAFGFGKSKARMISPQDGGVTFQDVAGVDEAKIELSEVVDFLKDPKKFEKLGAKIPKGCLLVGSPGTGKTLLARAVAGEANVPFFIVSGSDFVEMFVGVGASRVRDMFDQAKKHAPCILFIDEIDAVGRHRGAGVGGGNDEREQTLNQLLVEMDGFAPTLGIIVLAATNRPDVLDPALLRPGRFDRQVNVPYPDMGGREKILKVHTKKVPVSKDLDILTIAKGTTGFSGADLANLVNEAALMAARKNKTIVSHEEFELARDKIIMGSERRSLQLSDKDKELTAYHEAGHTVIALNVEGYYPLHKVTIIPRGRALGVTAVLPEKDEYNNSLKQLTSRLVVLFGGRIAEEMIYGKEYVSTGASGDIQMATNLARKMVTEWGYSDLLGRVRYESSENEVFLGHSVSQKKNISEATAAMIDAEVKRLIFEAEESARKILNDKFEELKILTKALLDFETLNAEEVGVILKGNDLEEFRKNKSLELKKEQEEKKQKDFENMELSSVPVFSDTLLDEEEKDKKV
jgi:cell division protease FtsH